MENVRTDVADSVQEDIQETVHQLFSALEKQHSIGINTVADIVVSRLEGVIIPEEESAELRERAAREGKTFSGLVVEYVNRGLKDDADSDRAFRQRERADALPNWSEPSKLMN